MKKLKEIICIFIGHSKIVTNCFGYISCARCGAQIGDALGGVWNGENAVIVGHNCDICQNNYKKLSWKDKILCPNPFKQ
jgi:DNA-directed RNA polymerase subunit RPC12/RpoP